MSLRKASIRTLGAMGLLWQAIGKLFPISLKFLLWVSLLISDFTNDLKIPKMSDNLKHSIVIAALKSSFSIYCNENNAAMDAA